jgi:hypothetical protein
MENGFSLIPSRVLSGDQHPLISRPVINIQKEFVP